MITFKQRSLLGRALGALTFALLALGGSPVHAIEIYIDPVEQTVQVGDSVSVDVTIGGLGDGTSPSLGAFDITVSFDSGILGSPGVVFGSELDVLGLGSFQLVTPGLGSIAVSELSLDEVTDLNDFQLAMFSLFTIEFQAIGVGSSVISLGPVLLSDESGLLALTAEVTGGRITVEPGTAVPAPATIALLLLGLAVAGRRVGFANRG